MHVHFKIGNMIAELLSVVLTTHSRKVVGDEIVFALYVLQLLSIVGKFECEFKKIL